MDFIQNKIISKISNLESMSSDGKYSSIAHLFKILMEYQLYLLFSCLWDKNRNSLTKDEIQDFIIKLQRPVLGTLLDTILLLNDRGEAEIPRYQIKQYKCLMSDFISIRNKYFAHGTIIPNIQNNIWKATCDELSNIYLEIKQLNIPILTEKGSYYYREGKSVDIAVFDCEVEHCKFLQIPQGMMKNIGLEEDSLCFITNNQSYVVSPFLHAKPATGFAEYELYYYNRYNIASNKFSYSKISHFDDNPEYDMIIDGYFQNYQTENRFTIQKANGIICNKFDNNYDYYINIPPISEYVDQVWDFILHGRSSTCLTIRGSGGIGKTALIQYVCTKFIFFPVKNKTTFEYVVFCSAKDRQLKQSKNILGTICYIDDESVVTNYKDILLLISRVLDLDIIPDTEMNVKAIEEAIVLQPGILLIIDDFETLPNCEKEKVIELISKLSIDTHKVIITTRSQYMIGREYYISELTEGQTIDFLKEYFGSYYDSEVSIKYQKLFESLVDNKHNRQKLYSLSQGLPLLSLQIAQLLIINEFHIDKIPDSWNTDVEDFLLGRLYSYFSNPTSKLLFIIIAQYYKYGCKEISIDEISYLYMLYCLFYNLINVDFDQDLIELKKLKIIYLGPSRIDVCNNISGKLLSECKQQFINDMIVSGKSGDIIDDEFIHIVVGKGIRDAVIEYASMQGNKICFEYIKLFSLANPFTYTNSERYFLIQRYLENVSDQIDADYLSSFYHQCGTYFSSEENFNDFYYNEVCLKYNCIIQELSYVNGNNNKNIIVYIRQLQDELESIQETIDEYVKQSHSGSVPNDYLRELSNKLRSMIGNTCKYTMPQVSEQVVIIKNSNQDELKIQLDEIKTSIEEIEKTIEKSRKIRFNIIDYGECQTLLDKLTT